MRLLCTLFVLVTTITIIYSAPLTSNQEVQLNNVAWLHAQFSLTFDGEELPLDSFYKDGEELEDYDRVDNFFSDNHLRENVFRSVVDWNDLTVQLQQRIFFYQNEIVEKNDVPMTFKEFHTIFKLMLDQQVFKQNYDTNEFKWVNKPLSDILSSKSLSTDFCSMRSRPNPNKIIDDLNKFEIYETFPLLSNKKRSKLETKDKKAFLFFNDIWQGSKDPKPMSWSYHHIIPSETLSEFYRNYYNLLLSKSKRMKEGQKAHSQPEFDWIKIMEFNTQKALLLQAKKLWAYSSKGATVPVIENRQQDFIRAYHRWLPGLIFLGPESSTRYDDPAITKNGEKIIKTWNSYYYDENRSNGFESRARCILGNGAYFYKVQQLNDELVAFNQAYKNRQPEDLNKEAMRLRTRLRTIHKEYDNGKPIWIIPYNPDFWLKPSTIPKPIRSVPLETTLNPEQVWGINTDLTDRVIYDMETNQWINMDDHGDDGPSIEMWKIKMEWLEKAEAQAEDNRQQMLQMNLELPMPNFDVLINPALGFFNINGAQEALNEASASVYNVQQEFKRFHDETKRRKRHHIPDSTTYISDLRDKCKTLDPTTTTKSVIKVVDFNHPKTDSCGYYLNTGTPSILAVPYWGLCKLFG